MKFIHVIFHISSDFSDKWDSYTESPVELDSLDDLLKWVRQQRKKVSIYYSPKRNAWVLGVKQ